MSKISVIIPVYNTSIYLEECLDSVKNQKYSEIEIIVVNDGSTDDSENIIKNWQEKNKDISCKYFYKANEGLSSARNYGVLQATGDYIMFLDSDDYIDSDLFKSLEKNMDENIDVIKFKMLTVDNDKKLLKKYDGPIFEKCSGEDALVKLVGQDNYIDIACIYLYKREYFIEHEFKYNTKNKYHEDFGLTSLVIANAKTFISTDVYGYYYRQTEDSITRNTDYNKTIQKAYDVLAHYDNMTNEIQKYNITQGTKDLLKKYYTNMVILKTEELNSTERKEYIKQIKQRKLYKNIKITNLKQLIKRILLTIDINLYLKMR